MRFVSLIFLNDGNIAISLMTIHLKRTAVHYANLKQAVFKLQAIEYAIFFFLISYLCLF